MNLIVAFLLMRLRSNRNGGTSFWDVVVVEFSSGDGLSIVGSPMLWLLAVDTVMDRSVAGAEEERSTAVV